MSRLGCRAAPRNAVDRPWTQPRAGLGAILAVAMLLALGGLLLPRPSATGRTAVGNSVAGSCGGLPDGTKLDQSLGAAGFPRAVLVVAHESGRSTATAAQALGCRADGIEIDVVAHGGQLYASHNPLPTHGMPTAPPLPRVWAVAAAAPIVELDLKQASPGFRALLLTFLAERRPLAPQVFVSTRDVSTLRVLRDGAPGVFRFLSIGSAAGLRALRTDPAMAALLDGVSIRQDLVDAKTVAWCHQRHLLVFAWTVNRPDQVRALLRDGVDGITTDQGGIVRALSDGGQNRPHRLRRVAPAAANPHS